MRRFLACCLMLAGLLASTPSALAHRVHLFAYVSSGQIVADCRFSRARPAKHAEVVVYDAASGRELLRGKSDEKGMARLAIPPELLQNPAALRLVVHAGEGHQAEWRLGAEALRGQQAVPPLASTAGDEPPAALSRSAPAQENTQPSVSTAELERAIDRALENKLAPIQSLLAAQQAENHARGPGFVEIVGGIGWIFGLFGVFAYLKSRKSQ